MPPAGIPTWLEEQTKSLLGEALLGQSRFGEAEPMLVSAYGELTKNPRGIPRAAEIGMDLKYDALRRAVRLYEAWDAAEPGYGHDRKAAEWRARLKTWQPASRPAETPPTDAPVDAPPR